MKKLLTGALLAGMLATGAQAADDVTLQLKWVTQAQFAGYYVAAAKGYYTEENLNVTIKPGGPDIAPEQVIAGGGADVIVAWMPAALAGSAFYGVMAAIERGVTFWHPSQRSRPG